MPDHNVNGGYGHQPNPTPPPPPPSTPQQQATTEGA